MMLGSDGDCTIPGATLSGKREHGEDGGYYNRQPPSDVSGCPFHNPPKKEKEYHDRQMPVVHTPESIIDIAEHTRKQIDGKWVPCRVQQYPKHGFFHRIITAWKVFVGEYDAVSWYKQ